LQVLQQHVRVVLDRRDRLPREQLREQPHHHLAVLEHVRHARGHAQVVLQHVVLAGACAHHVDARDVAVDAARQRQAAHLRPVLLVVEHHLARHDAGLDDALRVVDVVEEGVERAHALAQPGLQHRPLGRGDDARHDVERDQALGAFLLAVDGEGDADAVEGEFRLAPLGLDARGRRARQPLRELAIVGAGRAAPFEHLVVAVRHRPAPVAPGPRNDPDRDRSVAAHQPGLQAFAESPEIRPGQGLQRLSFRLRAQADAQSEPL